VNAQRTESFAAAAEYELSRLADLTAELGVINDPLASVIAHGMAAVANAVLSINARTEMAARHPEEDP
jgi:hypothetical protein